VGELDLEFQWERDSSYQVAQQFLFPAVQTVVVDLNAALIAGTKDER